MIPPQSRHSRDRERGQVVVLVAIMMPVLLGFAALVLDIGFLYADSRSAQAAADAGALAAAQHKMKNSSATDATLRTVAQSYTSSNGFTHGSGGVTVTVTIPPSGRTNNSNEYYIEVVVTRPLSGFFSGAVFSGLLKGYGRSVGAVLSQPPRYAVIALGEQDEDGCEDEAIEVDSGATLTVVAGSIFSNSCGSDAIENEGTITATSVEAVGSISNTGTINGTQVTGASPVTDPLGAIPRPSVSSPDCGDFELDSGGLLNGCVAASSVTGSCSSRYVVLNPGIYTKFEVECGTAWLKPGTYVLKGNGMEVDGDNSDGEGDYAAVKSCKNPARTGQPLGCGTVSTTDGVLLFNTTQDYPNCTGDNDEIEVEDGGILEIHAATTGTYANLAIFGDPCADDDDEGFEVDDDAGTVTIDGTVYLPHGEAEIEGAVTINGGLYVASLEVEREEDAVFGLTVNWNNGQNVVRIPFAVLVE